MIIVVTGGRDYQDRARVYAELDAIGCTFLHVGDCPSGADVFALAWAASSEHSQWKVYYANWTNGRRAGPIRNGEMLRMAGKTAIVLAFPGGKGTADCVKQARALGMEVREIKC